jgi:hypothetical protein
MPQPHPAPRAHADAHMRVRHCKSRLPASPVEAPALANGRFTMAGKAQGAA